MAEPIRKAKVTLTAAQVVQLMAGHSLCIRLRNVVGETQLLELNSVFASARQKFDMKELQKQVQQLKQKARL